MPYQKPMTSSLMDVIFNTCLNDVRCALSAFIDNNGYNLPDKIKEATLRFQYRSRINETLHN